MRKKKTGHVCVRSTVSHYRCTSFRYSRTRQHATQAGRATRQPRGSCFVATNQPRSSQPTNYPTRSLTCTSASSLCPFITICWSRSCFATSCQNHTQTRSTKSRERERAHIKYQGARQYKSQNKTHTHTSHTHTHQKRPRHDSYKTRNHALMKKKKR